MEFLGINLQILEFILKVITTLVVLFGGIAGFIRYFRDRHREFVIREEELAWKKTELVVKLSEHFDGDPNIQAAVKLLELGSPAHFREVTRILQTAMSELSEDELQVRYHIDRYLDFLDRIYQFVCVTKTLTAKDAACFTWYIRRIGQVPALKEFAEKNGYADLLKLHEVYKPLFQSREGE